MSWTSILTVLCLSIASAYLVLIEGWRYWEALILVGGGALLIVTGLILIVMIRSQAEERVQFLAGVKKGLREEWRATVKWVRGE